MSGRDRGQAYTLEGLIAAIILASAVLYGLQAVDVAPYTADDRSDRRLDALRTQVSDALAVAADNGTLRRAVTCIDPATGDPHPRLGQPPNAVTQGDETALGDILNASVGGVERDYIVQFDYWQPQPASGSARMESIVVYPDTGSSSFTFTREPVTATHQVLVFNSTSIRGADCAPTGSSVEDRVQNGDPLYLPYATPGTADRRVYAVVTVTVIAW